MNHSTAAIAALPTAMVRNLSTIGYSRGWTLYLYRTEDERSVVEMPGYFDDLAVLLAIGDHIHITGRDGRGMLVAVVASARGTVVVERI